MLIHMQIITYMWNVKQFNHTSLIIDKIGLCLSCSDEYDARANHLHETMKYSLYLGVLRNQTLRPIFRMSRPRAKTEKVAIGIPLFDHYNWTEESDLKCC